jgi:hypothetical protein
VLFEGPPGEELWLVLLCAGTESSSSSSSFMYLPQPCDCHHVAADNLTNCIQYDLPLL